MASLSLKGPPSFSLPTLIPLLRFLHFVSNIALCYLDIVPVFFVINAGAIVTVRVMEMHSLNKARVVKVEFSVNICNE